jgi:hypothetical protein
VKRLVKLVLVVAVVGALIVVARKLMGGLGPQPGDPAAPKEWPSLVPDPPSPEAAAGNGSVAIPDVGGAPDPSEHIAPTTDSGPNP